jgi:hypothetical protein
VASGDENLKHLSHGREGIPLKDNVPCLLIFNQMGFPRVDIKGLVLYLDDISEYFIFY